jgi:hypothetical protein
MFLLQVIRGGNIKSVEPFLIQEIPMSQFFKCITSQSFDVKVGQMGSWIAANTVFCVGMYKLTKLPLSETELFFGVLLVITPSLLMVLIGLILPLTYRKANDSIN